MSGRRFRPPSPAFVIATVALFAALGGTSFAATKVIASTHKDKKADTKLVKKLAPTLSVKHAKTADSATTAASATHATSAANATNATNATNAANATNAGKLGGIPAANYVSNSGSIFVSAGSSNWHSFDSSDPIEWLYTSNATWATASGAGSFTVTVHPSIPTALFGKNLKATAATLCYDASTSAKITGVSVVDSTYSNGGIGTANTVVNDTTNRTDDACRTYPFSSAVTLTSLDDLSIYVSITYSGAATLFLGQSGFTLSPTTATASAPKSSTGPAMHPTIRGSSTGR
jgi:hypothetical protein